jgi:hypothetical protein
MTELLIQAVATAICKSRTCEGINCCQWPAQGGRTRCPVKLGGYDAAARDAIAAYEAFQESERRRTCRHPRAIGGGSLGSDGSSSSQGYCPDCHQSWNYSTPARAEPERFDLNNVGRA